ncbi:MULTISPECIES: hypothetical protein [Parachlamydia]|jgi:hypothetical protein|uniref:Uncharacterized protein n=2 Tax=Parachlamydia acanthamoebae TaxID=83552 RepID=F8KY71_PARAV|nr:hypothetical protein [Parachlamydia acanthamoebae]EFB40865.1 hypothetical protein pah_c180o054 [Parachlamydia acanthamoebae str. Hall's coccus]KIA78492.1 hypothetical protein DB43_DY00430 [Parachlamydia acanthamoebae]CCB85806.1 putative uncharacterized protein [Parachlamydia acanthamoebae UV-7]
MKDAIHHRQYIQKKVIQSIRKEMEKQNKSLINGDDGVIHPVSQLIADTQEKRLSERRRPVRVSSRMAVH